MGPARTDDLDRADRNDKWRLLTLLLAILLIGAIGWAMYSGGQSSSRRAVSEASQKYTLAQQVAAACALKDQAGDLGGLCQSAKQIVKDGPQGSPGLQGPPGDTGPQGPLGPKGDQGFRGDQGLGQIGAAGLPGTTGTAGLNGAPGAAGTAGLNGTAGADGLKGVDGAAGATGAAGPVGAVGPAGATGAVGPAGASAYPFTFTFVITGPRTTWTVTCVMTAPGVVSTCTTV